MERPVVSVGLQCEGGAYIPVAVSFDAELVKLVGNRILHEYEHKLKASKLRNPTAQALWEQALANLRKSLHMLGVGQ